MTAAAAIAQGTLRRDATTVSLVSLAHGFSHFYQLALPPLFPLLRDYYDVSYAQLGTVTMTMYIVSGCGQLAAGFVVDRIGGRAVLFGGLTVFAGATLAAGFAPGFWALYPLAALAGLGNSVFHPADFALMNRLVQPGRLGRAYSVHGMCGSIGWALAPALGWVLGESFGWRAALVVMGAAGLAYVAFLILVRGALDERRAALRADRAGESPPPLNLGQSLRIFASAPILLCFAYFCLVSFSGTGVQTFGVPASMALYDATYGLASLGLSVYMLASAAGALAGGVLADRTARHDLVAAAGIAAAALALLAFVAAAPADPALLPLLALAGFCSGSTSPSRDMIVRAATPPGASGRVYGFVYSGFDVGSTVAPTIFGAMLDRGHPSWIFYVAAAVSLAMILTILRVPGARAVQRAAT